MAKILYRDSLVGGGVGALDELSPTGEPPIAIGDVALVINRHEFFAYKLKESAGAIENVPAVIIPDIDAGDLWWSRVDVTSSGYDKHHALRVELTDVTFDVPVDVANRYDQDMARMVQIWEGNKLSGDYDIYLVDETTTRIHKTSLGVAPSLSVVFWYK